MILLAVVFGCGKRDRFPVAGKVIFADGTPLAVGRVVVEYEDGKMASGRIKPDGGFIIGSLSESDGMKAGTYRVAIKDALSPKSEDSSEFETLIHSRFADRMKSGLTFTVPEQSFWNIVVERP